MYVIIIKRFVRLDREEEFLRAYRNDRTSHSDFLGETLTKLSVDEGIPETMASLFSPDPECATYLNIARWKRWDSFVGLCDMTPGWYDEDIEVAPRERAIFEIVEEAKGGSDVTP